MSLSGIFLSLHSPYPCFSIGHGETSRDSRTNDVFLKRANSPLCDLISRGPTLMSVEFRLIMHEIRRRVISRESIMRGKSLCGEAIVKRCARPRFLNARSFFPRETISKSVLVYQHE